MTDATQPASRGPMLAADGTPLGADGTPLAEGKEHREIDGRMYLLEHPIHADYALISGLRADRWGNVVYRRTARNFGPIMATAARTTVVVPLAKKAAKDKEEDYTAADGEGDEAADEAAVAAGEA